MLAQNYSSAMNTNHRMRNPQREYMESLLPYLQSSNSDNYDGVCACNGLPAIPESRQVISVSICPDNAKTLSQSASMTFQSLEDFSKVKLNRWASVPSKLKDEVMSKSLSKTNKQKKASRSNDSFNARKSSARRRTNTAPRLNDGWDLHRNSMQEERLGSARTPQNQNNSAARKAEHNLFDLDKIVQGLATPASTKSTSGKDPRDVSISTNSKPYTPLPSPISSQRIRRSQRTLDYHPIKKSALGPRYPQRQTSDPESISDGPRRPLRRASMELDTSSKFLMDASAKTV